MRELSVFVDESGNLGDDAKYYLLALVLHDQSKDVFEHIRRYESTLTQRGLRDIPLHMNPLMRANEDYKGMTAQERNRLLTCFSSFAWNARSLTRCSLTASLTSRATRACSPR